MKIEIGDREYDVKIAETQEDRAKGLQGVKDLKETDGLLFVYDKPQTVSFWMKDTPIALDIIFINEDCEVISVYKGKPNSLDEVEEDDVLYVLEVNIDSGIQEGDEIDFDDEEETPKMKIIGSDGETQGELDGGERIFSRKNTKSLIKAAKKAQISKSDRDYKALGKKVFKFLKTQDANEKEYVNKED